MDKLFLGILIFGSTLTASYATLAQGDPFLVHSYLMKSTLPLAAAAGR